MFLKKFWEDPPWSNAKYFSSNAPFQLHQMNAAISTILSPIFAPFWYDIFKANNVAEQQERVWSTIQTFDSESPEYFRGVPQEKISKIGQHFDILVDSCLKIFKIDSGTNYNFPQNQASQFLFPCFHIVMLICLYPFSDYAAQPLIMPSIKCTKEI